MLSYIFPGQGAQYPGMGKDLCNESKAAGKIFSMADEVLGFELSRLCFQGPQDELKCTDICQAAILTHSVAVLEAFRSMGRDPKPAFMAGLSLGEYSALVAAQTLSFPDALLLVRKRGMFMEEAAKEKKGAMAAVIGLDAEVIRQAALETGVDVANLNAPSQIVISGEDALISEAAKLLEARGAKRVIRLEVSGAFHSRLMKAASERLALEIDKTEFLKPQLPVVSNVTAKPFISPDEIKANLVKQVYSPVLWEDSVRFMAANGTKDFLEIGPGKTLAGILRKIDPELAVKSIDKYEEIKNT